MRDNERQQMETRILHNEIRLDGPEDDPQGAITGYAAVFDRQSENLGGFFEVIKPGAFSQAIESSDVRALINHNNNLILGRTTAGTLSLFEDDIGLGYTIDPPNTTYALDLLESLARGDVTQSSFGFTVADDHWLNEEGQTLPIRVITRIEQLYDVSPVTYPAYPQTSAAVRQLVFMNYGTGHVDMEAPQNTGHARGLARKRIELLRLK